MSWLAIWDGRRLTHVDARARHADLSHGTIRFEMSLHRPIRAPVLLWEGRTGTPRDLRMICHPDGTVSLEQGGTVIETPPGFLFAGEPLLAHYSWDALGKSDRLVLRNTQTGAARTVRPGAFAPRSLAEIVPETPGRQLSVAYAGIANHPLPDRPLPGLSGDTRVATPGGDVALCDLCPGMRVRTATGRDQTVRWIGATEHMARGEAAPVRLRAPYFGLAQDVIASRGQRILLSGCEVEYLFGAERVLARVDDIRHAPSARICLETPTVTTWHVLLDDHDCLLAGRCALDSAVLAEVLTARGKGGDRLAAGDRTPAWPVIDRASAQAYLALLAQNRPVAA